ncbi:MAG: LysR family transcriptional regulator [Pseudomonadota bacterium]
MDVFGAMQTFVAIVDEGSLTAAADALDRSQPAVVRSLAALEAHLGARLLHRTTRRMSLTPEGSEYLERARQILADVEEAERAASQNESEPSGQVRITAPVQFGQLHVAPLLTQFLSQQPRLTAQLLLLDRNVDLVDDGIDIAVRIGPLPDSELVALPVGELRRVVCASPALLASVDKPDKPESLAQLPCVRVETLARSGTWSFRRGRSTVGVKVSGPLACNQVAAAISACVHGAGFGQFLSYQVNEQLRTGQLVRVLERFEVDAIPVNVVYSGGRFASARQRAVAKHLQTALRERVFRGD